MLDAETHQVERGQRDAMVRVGLTTRTSVAAVLALGRHEFQNAVNVRRGRLEVRAKRVQLQNMSREVLARADAQVHDSVVDARIDALGVVSELGPQHIRRQGPLDEPDGAIFARLREFAGHHFKCFTERLLRHFSFVSIEGLINGTMPIFYCCKSFN